MMKAKKRNQENSLSNGKKVTRHFYINNSLYDSMIEESNELGINVSRLLEHKLESLKQIKFLILKRENKSPSLNS